MALLLGANANPQNGHRPSRVGACTERGKPLPSLCSVSQDLLEECLSVSGSQAVKKYTPVG